jgi:glycosyltransferase involved in cell wall biosynthesis
VLEVFVDTYNQFGKAEMLSRAQNPGKEFPFLSWISSDDCLLTPNNIKYLHMFGFFVILIKKLRGVRRLKNTLYIVIPCYNEEAALPETAAVLLEKTRALIHSGKISARSRVLLVDDGSADGTWALIEKLSAETEDFTGVNFSRNRGTQNGILAGLTEARAHGADVVISTDADLQDDIDAIDWMLDEYHNGCDVVYGVRAKRDTDAFFKRFTAEAYDRLLAWLGCGVVFNHSDYRLLSARAIDALAEYGERDLFLRGVVPMLGFKSAAVSYERRARVAGETKYTFKSLANLAVNGATSLSLRPVRLVLQLGVLLTVFALALFVFSLVRLCFGYPMLNWKIILVSVWGVGGLILIGLGVVGEYAGRAYMEAKKRPRYHIDGRAGFETENSGNSEVNG